MPWNTETSEIFIEESKSEIFLRTQDEVSRQIERAKKFPVEERSMIAFGGVFETLVVEENLEKHPETDRQKAIRNLISDLYQNSSVSLGEQWASKPDFVSVVFDSHGNLVIDEIVEMKTSNRALEHGLEKKQPENAIKTIEKVVSLINEMKNTPDIRQVASINKFNGKYDQYKRKFLTNTFHKIKEMGLSEDITFSADLKYHVILSQGETKTSSDFQVTRGENSVKVVITESQFSKKDIHKIIDHYAETP